MPADHDPRSEAEKARAALMRNDAMGMAASESPLERQPSVTPKTFGDGSAAAQLRSGIDQGVEAGGVRPAEGDGGEAESIAAAEQVATRRDGTAPARQISPSGDDDVLSRGKE